MDKLSKFVYFLRRGDEDELQRRISAKPSSSSYSDDEDDDDDEDEKDKDNKAKTIFAEESHGGISQRDFQASTRILSVLESILLWENTVNSISVVIVFHVIFWGTVVLEVRGFAAASSAALFAVLGYSTLEAQAKRETKPPDTNESPPKVERISKIVKKAKSALETLKFFRKDQPGAFCAAVCTFSIVLWLIGSTINGVLLTYAICMTVLIGPALLLRVPCKIFSPKELCHEYTVEWDNEIEEFLPAVTEDNLEVLQRAGDTGEHSPIPHGAVTENHIGELECSAHEHLRDGDPLNEEELIGLKMPSHEDGSTDGLDVSELDLSTGDNDADSMKIQSEHFEPGSSSDEEAELEPVSRKLPSHSDDESDSEFEIIDSREIANLDDV